MEEGNDLFIQIFALIAGTFVILASIFNWEFFFKSRNVQFFIRIIGRNGTRIFYGCVGLFLYYTVFTMQIKVIK